MYFPPSLRRVQSLRAQLTRELATLPEVSAARAEELLWFRKDAVLGDCQEMFERNR